MAGARVLATVRVQPGAAGCNTLVGAPVLVPGPSWGAPKRLLDLQCTRIAAVDLAAVGAWLGIARELRGLGIDAGHAAHLAVFKTHANAASAVRRSEFDARVAFSAFPPETAPHTVAIALLRHSRHGQAAWTAAGALWSLPMSSQPVHGAMAELRTGPYGDAGTVPWKALVHEHSGTALLLLACVIGFLLVVVLRISRLNRELGRAQEELRREFGLRMQAQERRLASEVRFHQLFNQSAAGICMTDAEGRLVEANPAMCSMLGYTGRELSMTGVEHLTHPEDAAGEAALIQEMRAGGRPSYALEKRLRHRDGSYIWVHFTASRMIVPIDGAVLEIGVAENITEHKLAEAERERLIAELQRAMAEVKTLTGLLPICASCRKVRDDQGYWKQVEEYLQDKTDVRFTHGICPACFSRLYPEYE